MLNIAYPADPNTVKIIQNFDNKGIPTQCQSGKEAFFNAPELIVPGSYWFAAEVINSNAFSLVGCIVSPGFKCLNT